MAPIIKGQVFRSPILGTRLYIPDFQEDGHSGPACFSKDMEPDPAALAKINASVDLNSRIEAYTHIRDIEIPGELAEYLRRRASVMEDDGRFRGEFSALLS